MFWDELIYHCYDDDNDTKDASKQQLALVKGFIRTGTITVFWLS